MRDIKQVYNLQYMPPHLIKPDQKSIYAPVCDNDISCTPVLLSEGTQSWAECKLAQSTSFHTRAQVLVISDSGGLYL